MNKKNWIKRNAVSLVALLISIVSIFIACFRAKNVEIDLLGIAVGILCALVTVLIGWQVYNLFDFKEKTKKYDFIINNLTETTIRSNATNSYNFAMVYYRSKDTFNFLKHALTSISYASDIDEIDTCNVFIKGANEVCSQGIYLTENQKKELLKLFYGIKKIDLLEGQEKLEKVILDAEIKEESEFYE